MTNNPTIDGVSRELLEQIHKELTSGAVSIGTGAKVRTLLDREVITDDHLRQRIAFLNSEVHAKSDVNAVLQSTIARLEAQLNNAINMDFQRRERITQLESEAEFAAATYQAARDRIAELESGRGEAPFYISVEDWNLLVRDDVEIASVRASRTRRSKFTEPLFAAPPAPVLPERKPVTVGLLSESNTHNQGWNACLDAAAALNKSP